MPSLSAAEGRRFLQKRRRNPESGIQTAIVNYLRRALPAGYRAMSIPNGGKRNAITGAILKREGAMAGAPDLQIVGPQGAVAFIEVKAPGGSLSPAQKDFRNWCGEWSIPFCVARGISDVEAFLLDLNVPIRARAA